jgi:glucose-6-phosphate dehydrogenase assembly protein OpcA
MATNSDLQRPSLFNLIIYTADEQRRNYYNDLVTTLIQRFPCRIISIEHNPLERQTNYEVIETTLSSTGDGVSMVCNKTIIRSSGDGIKRVPFTILSTLSPDIPIFLLWGVDPTVDDYILPSLQHFANQLIFDSENTSDLKAFAQRLLEKRKKWGFRIVDMNWTRFSGWRQVLVQTFDTKSRIEDLYKLTDVEITYNLLSSPSFNHQELQATFMEAWLASRLKWKPNNTEKDSRGYTTSQGSHLRVTMKHGSKTTFAPGALLSIDMKTDNGNSTLLSRTEKSPKQVAVHLSSLETCQLPFSITLNSMTQGPTFIKQMLYTPVSVHYFNALEAIIQRKPDVKHT